MRFHLIAAMLMVGVAVPAAAQRPESTERRLDRVEQELRAVQRRVFPGANGAMIAPEMDDSARPAPTSGVPASSAVADINARLDSVENQLRALTGQAEQNANQLRVIQTNLADLRQATGTRLDALERPGPAPSQVAAATPVDLPP